jgi:hypothetical protein
MKFRNGTEQTGDKDKHETEEGHSNIDLVVQFVAAVKEILIFYAKGLKLLLGTGAAAALMAASMAAVIVVFVLFVTCIIPCVIGGIVTGVILRIVCGMVSGTVVPAILSAHGKILLSNILNICIHQHNNTKKRIRTERKAPRRLVKNLRGA